MSTRAVVDGPNLYNDVVRFFLKEASNPPPDVQQRYFAEWFDVDRLVRATLRDELRLEACDDLGTVIFHSRKALGPTGPAHIAGDKLDEFWGRQGSNPGTAAMLIDIPGSPSGSEKGIDTSIVVYLYETIERWQAAILFTNDTDFVPVVWSLRRKGNRVFCASDVGDRTSPAVTGSSL